jgi:hypothetical protein
MVGSSDRDFIATYEAAPLGRDLILRKSKHDSIPTVPDQSAHRLLRLSRAGAIGGVHIQNKRS